MLIASILFYAWGEPIFIFALLASVTINYFFGIKISSSNNTTRDNRKKAWLTCSIVFNVMVLVIFKYLTFLLTNISVVVPVPVIDIKLPIGISFYTFQIMSYEFDVYYGTAPAQRKISSLALYIMMFPQLIAGPIVRYSSIEKEIQERQVTLHDIEQGSTRFVKGLAKKVLIADFLAGISDRVFLSAEFAGITMIAAWIGAIAYTLEIYYDFSGYSDMAIGLGRCLGFHFQENFNKPYRAVNITEFWRRWHISLTDWFRDYVYIPLGGNRVSTRRHIFNLLIVWLLTGVWHGASWNFVLWGLIYFFLQLFEKYTHFVEKLPYCLARCYTMLFVIICWVIFKAQDISSAFEYLKDMFINIAAFTDGESWRLLSGSAIVMLIAVVGCTPAVEYIGKGVRNIAGRSICAILELIAVIALLCLSILVILNGEYSPFIYFNF